MLPALLSIFALAVLSPFLTRRLGRASGWFFALFPAAITAWLITQVPRIVDGRPRGELFPWVPELGATVALRLDGLSLLMALLICGIGTFILIYAGSYLKTSTHLPRFYAYLLGFMGAMLGVVLADDLITLYIFWELTSLTSYLLIGYEHHSEKARKAALQALVVTASGGLCFLAAAVLTLNITGTTIISDMDARAIQSHAHYTPIVILVLLAAFTKSAQFPFHFWLPGAMAAPTPVSAYLHSSTMVKAGVYMLARFNPLLGGAAVGSGIPSLEDQPLWETALIIFGTITMLLTAWQAIQATDLKRILAYTTASALGTLVLLIGIGTREAAIAAAGYLLAHALYKGSLFLVAGSVDHATGERDVTRLGGLARTMPAIAAIALIAAASMAGLIPTIGFVGKELALEAAGHSPLWGTVLLVAIAINGALSVTAALLVGWKPFWSRPTEAADHAHDPPAAMWSGPAILAVLGLAAGLLIAHVGAQAITPAASAIAGEAINQTFKLWHGFNQALFISIGVTIGGLILYVAIRPLRALGRGLTAALGWAAPENGYNALMAGLMAIGRLSTRGFQTGYLRTYVLYSVITMVALIGGAMIMGRLGFSLTAWTDMKLYEAAVVAVAFISLGTILRSRRRLTAIAGLGALGYSVTLIFALFSAPDLALTQFAIETLTVILFVLILYRLPSFGRYSGTPQRLRDAVVAILAGGTITILILAAQDVRPFPPISGYHLETSVPLAHGRNVVNVIIVDYRALDTLGEITVLGIAAVGVFTLLRLGMRRRRPA